MTPRLIFFTPGVAAPEPRPRRSRDGRIYVPSDAHTWKHSVRAAAVEHLLRNPGAALPDGAAWGVHLEFVRRRPAGHYGTGRNAQSVRASAPSRPTSKPDVDNLAKAVLDALGAWDDLPPLFWFDDAQVVELRVAKKWADESDREGVLIHLYHLEK